MVRIGERRTFRMGGGGELTRMLCARFRYENSLADGLLTALPHVIVIRPDRARGDTWLDVSARALMDEVMHDRPGSAIAIGRLLDLVSSRRCASGAWITRAKPAGLAGAGDPRIGRALTLIHDRPHIAWTVTDLAAHAGLSRSSFATRFSALVGKTPAAYVANWRMNLAADMLCGGQESIKVIAAKVGYGAEAAFSRAFKSRFSFSPSSYRQRFVSSR